MSSFSPAPSLYKTKWKDRYTFLKLPQEPEDLVEIIVRTLNLEKGKDQIWPGGKNRKPSKYQDIMES